MKPSAHRLLIRIFVSLLALAVFSAVPAFAAAIRVTNQADSGPGSLRDAIAAAAPGDTINFSLTLPGTITLTSGELLISKNLTINGPGASSLAIDGSNSSRVFEIASGFTVAISGLTIQNGSAGSGGGIYNAGTLTLSNITVSGNSASGDGGGGIYNCRTLTVTNSTLSGNSATSGYGGGIENFCLGTLIVANSTLSRNFANGEGGGIVSINGTVTLADSTISGNSITGGNGGAGIANFGSSTLSVTNSTISGNSMPYGIGGGIYNYGITTLTNSTISGNSASYGGGVYNGGGTFTLKNAIVANDPSGGNCFADNGTAFSSQGYNLSDDSTCSSSLNQTGDLNSTPAGLDPSGLKANGGPTQTIALLARSAGVDAIPVSQTNYCTDVNGAPVTTDQRGVTRPQGAACDIGAFELVTDDDSQFSQLNGGNTFSGNQTVNGNVSATNFVGNGAGLTGVITGVTAGAGLTGGGTGGNVGLSLASAACGAGSAITAHPFTCTAFPTFGANTFTGNQTMPSLTAGSINSGVGIFSASGAVALAGVSNSSYGVSGNSSSGVGVGGASTNGYGVAGNSTSSVGVGGASINSYGVYAASNNGVGIFGTTASTSATVAAGVFNNSAGNGVGNILLGQSAGATRFSVDGFGDVIANGSVKIGGGTPILEHLSVIVNPFFGTSLKPSTCSIFYLGGVTGASDGDSVTLGVPNSRMAVGSAVIYSAWVTGVNSIAIRVCNIDPNINLKDLGSGTIRVDIWKH